MNGSLLSMALTAVGWLPSAGAAPVPGGIVEMELAASGTDPPSVFYGSRRCLVRRAGDGWQALIAIDLDAAPGDYVVRIEGPDEDPVHRTLTIRPHPRAPITRSAASDPSVADKAGYPPHAPATPRHEWRPEMDANLPLSYPVYRSVLLQSDRRYGNRRLGADGAYAWELDLAFRVRNNSRVVSPGGGVISHVVSAGPRAFAVYVDHGMGLISALYPVTEVKVAPGDRVSRGAMLGRLYNPLQETPVVVGWRLRLNGTDADPGLLAGEGYAAAGDASTDGSEETGITEDPPQPTP